MGIFRDFSRFLEIFGDFLRFLEILGQLNQLVESVESVGPVESAVFSWSSQLARQ